jgi:acyl-coenzyme A synthetase/AMP-(fatty) acid ligase
MPTQESSYRSHLRGYSLTGDLMYRDADGYYNHVDRAADAVDLGGGHWLYIAMSEERTLTACPDVRDCTVLAGSTPDGTVVTDVLLVSDAAEPPCRHRPRARYCRNPRRHRRPSGRTSYGSADRGHLM